MTNIILSTIQIKRGTLANMPVLIDGELYYAYDVKEYHIGINGTTNLLSKDFQVSVLGAIQSLQNSQGPATFRDITTGETFSFAVTTPTNIYGNIVVSKAAETLNEGTTTTFTVMLDKIPTNNQTVILSTNNVDVTLDKTTLTFTPTNYNIAQTVTVTVATDSDTLNDNCIITISSPNVNSETLTLTITDLTVPTNPISVTAISLNKSTSNLNVGSTEQLTVTFTPSNATNQNVAWSSSDTSIATVSINGLVTVVRSGSATITATSADGGYTSICSYTVTASDFTGMQNAYIQNSYMYVNPSTILDTDCTIRTSTDTSHIYFSMGPFITSINLALGGSNTVNGSTASNVFNGVIPYAGDQVLSSFTSGSVNCPDTCYITSGNNIYIRIPASLYANNSNSIPMTLYSITQRLPVIKGAANAEIVVTDAIIDGITSLSSITVTNNMWTGFASMASGGLGAAYASITIGVNSISGRYTSTLTTRELWYVNATIRLNFKIPQAEMVTCDLASVKQYLKDNRLTFWVAQ